MKIVQAQKIESISDYVIIDAELPEPGADEVLVKIEACGMGYVDALVALGGYQVKPPLPFTPGQEIAGTIEAVGTNVSKFQVGDRVLGGVFGGGLAEHIVLPAAAAEKIPPNMEFAQAAIFRINYLTALHALRDRAAIKEGERLLVVGAAGGGGSAAIQVGTLLGANVVGVASTQEKRSFTQALGAHATLETDVNGWRNRVKDSFVGAGPDVIFDPVSGPLFEPAFRSLSWGGRHLVVGFVGGPIPALPVNLPLMKGSALVGVDVRQFLMFEPDRAREHLAELLGWVASGHLVPPVGKRFPFSAFADAIQFAMSGAGIGRCVVEMTGAA